MKPGALFFCHVFCHRTLAYHFEDNGDDDFMTRYFFSGGTMPSLDLFLHFQDHLKVTSLDYINGVHYSRCLENWLRLQDAQKRDIMPLFQVLRVEAVWMVPVAGLLRCGARGCRASAHSHARRTRTVPRRPASGLCTGACSTSRARSCSSTTAESSMG